MKKVKFVFMLKETRFKSKFFYFICDKIQQERNGSIPRLHVETLSAATFLLHLSHPCLRILNSQPNMVQHQD